MITSSSASRKTIRVRMLSRPRALRLSLISSKGRPERESMTTARWVCCSGMSWALTTAPNSDGGRLSITTYSRSSRTSAALERPAPDMPVTIRTCGASRVEVMPMSAVEGSVQVVGDGLGHDLGQVVHVGLSHLPQRPETAERVALALGADTRHGVEDRIDHGVRPELLVIGVGEAVCLVPDLLQEIERLGVAGDAK